MQPPVSEMFSYVIHRECHRVTGLSVMASRLRQNRRSAHDLCKPTLVQRASKTVISSAERNVKVLAFTCKSKAIWSLDRPTLRQDQSPSGPTNLNGKSQDPRTALPTLRFHHECLFRKIARIDMPSTSMFRIMTRFSMDNCLIHFIYELFA